MSARRGRPLRGAIIGFGNAAVKAHLPVWQRVSGYQLVAVVDKEAARLDLAKDLLPQVHRYSSAAELLAAEKLDFFDIITPPAGHAETIRQAAEHRLHAICEKPLALSESDYCEIEELATAKRVVIYTVDNWKFAPLIRTVRRLLTRGEIGHVTRVELEISRCQPPGGAAPSEQEWRLDRTLAGGGIAVDHGWHAFYLLQFFIGSQPLAVSAKLERRKFTNHEVEDTAEIEVEFSSSEGHLFLTWAGEKRSNLGRIVGERGTIEMLDNRVAVSIAGQSRQDYTFSRALSADSYHPEWFEPMLACFREEVLEPEVRGTNLRQALACAALVFGTYRSDENGGVRVPLEVLTGEQPLTELPESSGPPTSGEY